MRWHNGLQTANRDIWEIWGDYGHGFELLTANVTWAAHKEDWKAYRENEPGTPLKRKITRERIDK